MKKINWLKSTLLVSAALLAFELHAEPILLAETIKPKVSIVIDDLGDNSIIARKMLSLPGRMTAAILPHTPHAERIAKIASDNGHDVIMHLPMEAFSRPDLLGPGALMSNMDKQTFLSQFNNNIASIPNLIGFNNHMGSLLTEDKEKMQWLMEQAKTNDFYFLDSKTSQSSIAEEIANLNGIPSFSRDIFLDHQSDKVNLEGQFLRLKRIAQKTGKVVVICHPYPETLAFLENNIAELSNNFSLVSLSDLLKPTTISFSQPKVVSD
jgi:uncharacterized protein